MVCRDRPAQRSWVRPAFPQRGIPFPVVLAVFRRRIRLPLVRSHLQRGTGAIHEPHRRGPRDGHRKRDRPDTRPGTANRGSPEGRRLRWRLWSRAHQGRRLSGEATLGADHPQGTRTSTFSPAGLRLQSASNFQRSSHHAETDRPGRYRYRGCTGNRRRYSPPDG